MQSAVGTIAKNPRRLAARDFWARPPLRVRIQDEISSRLLCPHVDSSPGVRLIVHFSKSVALLAIFFLQMYLGAPSEAGIRKVSRMHYREQHCRSNGNLKSIVGRDVVRCDGTSRTRSIVVEAQGANTIAYLRI